MIKFLWDELGTHLVVYLVFMPFWGLLGMGSLNYYVARSHVPEIKLREFLDNLQGPFRMLLKVYYGAPQEKVISIISNATASSSVMIRVIGGIFPILFILVSIFNLLVYEHDVQQIIASLAFIGLFGCTFLIMWRFGHNLSKH